MQTERATFNKNKKKIQDAVSNMQPGDYLRLRKLTPREFLRLMGLVDSEITAMLNSGNPEAELYKQGGNSIAVPCLTHLFRKMFIERGPDVGQSYNLF